MRAWRITAYISLGALLLALGFSVGAICAKRTFSPRSVLKPIGPPPELSGLGSTVWKLTSGLTFIEEFIWAMYEEEATGLTQPDQLLGHAYNTITNSDKLEELFSGTRSEYQDDPEYWLERWLYWNCLAGYLGPSSPPEQEIERQIAEALAGMKQFGETYAPITYRLFVDAGLSEKEENYYLEILHGLQPDNGYIDVMLAGKMHETATIEELLELLRTAGEKPEFKVPVAPLTEVLAEHWLKQNEVVAPMLAFRYTEVDPRVPSLLGFRKAIRRIIAELDDEDLIAAIPILKRVFIRLSRLQPRAAGIHQLSAALIMRDICWAATAAYTRAGNEKAAGKSRGQEARIARLIECFRAGIFQYEDLKLRIERGSGRRFRDCVIFSDFIKWFEFGDMERLDGLVDKYDEFEYPPLKPEPVAAEGGKAP